MQRGKLDKTYAIVSGGQGGRDIPATQGKFADFALIHPGCQGESPGIGRTNDHEGRFSTLARVGHAKK